MSVAFPEESWKIFQDILRGRILWRRLFVILHVITGISIGLQWSAMFSTATATSLAGVALGGYMLDFGLPLNAKRKKALAILREV